MASKTTQLSVRLEEDKAAFLREIAAHEGTSVNQLLNSQITALIAEKKDSVLAAVRRKAAWLDEAAAEFEREAREQASRADHGKTDDLDERDAP